MTLSTGDQTGVQRSPVLPWLRPRRCRSILDEFGQCSYLNTEHGVGCELDQRAGTDRTDMMNRGAHRLQRTAGQHRRHRRDRRVVPLRPPGASRETGASSRSMPRACALLPSSRIQSTDSVEAFDGSGPGRHRREGAVFEVGPDESRCRVVTRTIEMTKSALVAALEGVSAQRAPAASKESTAFGVRFQTGGDDALRRLAAIRRPMAPRPRMRSLTWRFSEISGSFWP